MNVECRWYGEYFDSIVIRDSSLNEVLCDEIEYRKFGEKNYYYDFFISYINGKFDDEKGVIDSIVPISQYRDYNEETAKPQIAKLILDDLAKGNKTELIELLDSVLLYNERLQNLSSIQRLAAYCSYKGREFAEDVMSFTCSNAKLRTSVSTVNDQDRTRLYNSGYFEKVQKKDRSLDDVFSYILDIKPPFSFYYLYEFPSLCDLIKFLVSKMIENGCVIKKCKNCGKYFVPNRSDVVYCGDRSPQDSSRTCRGYITYITQLDKTRYDESRSIHKQIYNSMLNKFKRSGNPTYQTRLNSFMEDAQKWKDKIKSGEATSEEYVLWLKKIKAEGYNADN